MHQAVLASVVGDYDRQGWHRTGTAVDAASGRWLLAALARAGVAGRLERWSYDAVVSGAGAVVVDGRRTPALVMADSAPTPPTGLRGRLGLAGGDAEIALVDATPAGDAKALDDARRPGAHRAVVVVCGPPGGGLAPRNAEGADRSPGPSGPSGPPVLQVAPRHGAALRAALGRVVEVVAAPAPGPVVAANVVGRTDQDGQVALTVLTPRSGWWHCAAERAGGIAAWLHVAERLSARPAGDTAAVAFAATSGHELGYLGARRLLDAHPELAGGAPWLHLGANIGARGGAIGIDASTPALARLAAAALEAAGCPAAAVSAGNPRGEATELAARHLPYVSLVGSSPVFHQRRDRAAMVDLDRLARLAEAIAGIADGLLAPPPAAHLPEETS